MPLNTTLRKAVGIINKQTKSLQGGVTHRAWVKQDGFGDPTYSPVGGVLRQAIIDQTVAERKLPSGRLVMVKAALTFLTPVEPQGTAGREEPIDPRDSIVLPDGSTGPIVMVGKGVIDPETHAAFAIQVWLGGGA